MAKIAIGCVVLLLTVVVTFFVTREIVSEPHRHEPVYFATRDAVNVDQGVVVTSQPIASRVGLEVLRSGGNAIDAAVASAAALSVIEPYMSGPGGDLFALVWKDGSLSGLNASGRSGSLFSLDAVADLDEIPEHGVESVTVPGAVSGWHELLERHGTMTLADALRPAIEIAEAGFEVSRITATEWSLFGSAFDGHPGASAVFKPGGLPPKRGDRFANPDLAEIYREISRDGISSFYDGTIGRRIAAHIEDLGGFVTFDDLRTHQSEWVEPISVRFGDYRVWQLPPNGQGIATLEMLRILERFDLAAMGHNTATYLHHLIEAKKLAFADLFHFVADPGSMSIDPDQLLDDTFITARVERLDPDQANDNVHPDISLTTSNTTYLTVADSDGNIVSLIASLAGGFGSGVVVPGTGFALQNRGLGFTPAADLANSAAPNKRPLHTIIPGFVTRSEPDGTEQPWLSFGLVGGHQQPQAQVQILLNMMVFGMDVQRALDAGRFRHNFGRQANFETTIPLGVVRDLEQLGHVSAHSFIPGLNGLVFGNAQAIHFDGNHVQAASDPRRDGEAAAY